LLKGKLPWQGLDAASKEEKYQKIKEKKLEISFTELCEGVPGIKKIARLIFLIKFKSL
jgi:hypothetical protein